MRLSWTQAALVLDVIRAASEGPSLGEGLDGIVPQLTRLIPHSQGHFALASDEAEEQPVLTWSAPPRGWPVAVSAKRGWWVLERERPTEDGRRFLCSLQRPPGTPRFSPGEAAALQLVLPALAASATTGMTSSPAPEHGLALVGPAGEVVEADPLARAWLNALHEPLLFDPTDRPGTLSRLKDPSGPEVTVRVLESGGVWLRATLVRTGSGPTAVVLDRAPPGSPQLFEAVAAAAALSPAERDVVRRVVRGASDKEIAYALEVSIHTVKSRLRRAQRKLGARNRTALVSRLCGAAPLEAERARSTGRSPGAAEPTRHEGERPS